MVTTLILSEPFRNGLCLAFLGQNPCFLADDQVFKTLDT